MLADALDSISHFAPVAPSPHPDFYIYIRTSKHAEMGLFNKKKENRSPSGHFTDDVTPSGEKDEQSAMRPTEETHREASSSSRKDLTGGEHEHAHESDAASTSKPNLRDAEVAGAAAEEHKETVGEDGAVKETTAVESTSVEPAKTDTGETVPVQETTRVEATTIEGVSPAAAGENKVKEVAMAPHGHHRQPASDAALSPEDAAVAEHDHKYLKPVVRESPDLATFSLRQSPIRHRTGG